MADWNGFIREIDRGLSKFVRSTYVQTLVGLYFLCDILPHLPEPIAKKIMNKVLGLLGLGD